MMKDSEYYESLICSKKYFDNLSFEFNSADINQNLINISLFLNKGGNLHYLISKYKRNKSLITRNAVKQTIEFYLRYLAEEEYLFLDNYSESQLITILSNELKNRLLEDYNLSSKKFELKITLGNFNPNWTFKEDKETLFYDNPWLDLVESVENNLYLPLEENIHIEDKRYIDEFNSTVDNDYAYKLGILPEPFWGNVFDAKIAILTLNPGYIHSKNYEEYEKLDEDEKNQFIKDQCNSMSLKSTEFIPSNENRNNISDHYWDKKTKQLRKDFKDANSKIALIQYVGYTSAKYKDLPKKITRKIYRLEDDILYTQKFAVRLVEYLMQQNRVIIIARKKNLWFKNVKGLENYEKLIILDNYRNTYITPGNCKKSGKWKLIENALNE